jgi:Ulp1 family protease
MTTSLAYINNPGSIPRLATELPENAKIAVQRLIDDESCVLRIGDQDLGHSDLSRLRDGFWFNDTIINSYAELINRRAKNEGVPHVWVTSSFFYKMLKDCNDSDEDWNHIIRWSRSVSLT